MKSIFQKQFGLSSLSVVSKITLYKHHTYTLRGREGEGEGGNREGEGGYTSILIWIF